MSEQGYLGNPLLKRSGVNIAFTKEQVEEYIKCMNDPVYFIKKYVKIVNVDHGLMLFDLWPFQENMVRTLHDNRFVICKFPRQVGKANFIGTPVATPNGWSTIGDLKTGDYVFGTDGKPTQVLGKSPVYTDHECYKVHFDSGDSIIADEEHLWEIYSSDWTENGGRKVMTTKDIIQYVNNREISSCQPYIKLSDPVQYTEKEYDIDPYSFGLQVNKNISLEYMIGSVEQRTELLKGLLDSDRHFVVRNNTIRFFEKSKEFCEQIQELLASLGIKSKITFKTVNGEVYYTVTFQKQGTECKKIYITKIEKCDSVPVQCIKVAADNSLFLIGRHYIPTHNTQTVAAYFLYYIIFNPDKKAAILANKSRTAKEILSRIKKSFEYLPKWIQPGVEEWNKYSIVLDNGSKIMAAATSSSAIRGESINLLLLDEFAHIHPNQAEEFFASVYPTISSGQTTKVFIVSTPNGMNQFYKLWVDAVEGRSLYVPLSIHYSEVPGRDEAWKQREIANTSLEQFEQEHNCEFLGSVNTLISAAKLKQLVHTNPIKHIEDGLDIYEDPIDGHDYVLIADTSRGVSIDYSAFIIVDITKLPYKMVAKYRNNKIPPMVYPDLIYPVAKKYNNAWVLIELNDAGSEVANILTNVLEYENIIRVSHRGRRGQVADSGFGGSRTENGIRTSPATKRIGCSSLKHLIEDDKLIINDADTIFELSTFVSRKASYEADYGAHDDLVMCLVILGWLTNQPIFKELIKKETREILYADQIKKIEQELTPFGFINPNTSTEETTFVDSEGTTWDIVQSDDDEIGKFFSL